MTNVTPAIVAMIAGVIAIVAVVVSQWAQTRTINLSYPGTSYQELA